MMNRIKLNPSACSPSSAVNMLVEVLCRQCPSTRVNSKFYLLFVFVLIHCWTGCMGIKLFPDKHPEPMLNRFTNYDGNLPEKLLPNWPIAQRTTQEDSIDRNRLQLGSFGPLSAEQEDNSAESFSDSSSLSGEPQSLVEVLPRRERRLSWNRWLQWFAPMDRISVGFMPVRGRKNSFTFIAARGKKSLVPSTRSTMVNSMSSTDVDRSQSLLNSVISNAPVKMYYYLMALTVKPVLTSEVDRMN